MIAAFLAYLMWGVLPVYFKLVEDVTAIEVLAHRIIWAIPFGALILFGRRQWPEVRRALADPRVVGFLVLTAVLIAGNWFVYIWAIQNDQILQASLGYYINPLLFTLAGVLLFGEKLTTVQIAALILAAAGVLILTISSGQIPAIALILGTLFTIYGVIRKRIIVGGMPGLFIETLVLFPLSMAYLIWIMMSGAAAFEVGNPSMIGLLILAGPVTVLPLLCFALATRRLNLSTVGFMQFIAPSLQFVIGLLYGEQLTSAHVICFGLIWLAVGLFSWDAWRSSRRKASAIGQVTKSVETID